MKALLICPADRPEVAFLAENAPLALAPLLGRSLVEYWIEALVARGIRHIVVLASDRPHQIRAALGDGTRWGVQLDLIPQSRELTVSEARARYGGRDAADADIILMEHLPGFPDHALFEGYDSWYDALQAFMPHAITPARIGARELQPGVWVGLHAQIAPSVRLQGPCWIGESVVVSAGACIGPNAILEDRAVIESGAQVREGIVGPETFVGEMISLHRSLAHGGTVVNWESGSCLRVPDAFLLCSLRDRHIELQGPSIIGRLLAAGAMLITAPLAFVVMLISLVRGDPPLQLRLGVRPQRNMRSAALQTFAYYELTAGSNWLKRWPQFWSVVHGNLTWVGNRPLRPTQALALANDFERLWLTVPVGLVSLADAHGCTDGLSDEICAHASYYAVNASWRLDWFVLSRALLRAAAAIPIRRFSRRKASSVPLPRLVPKQEG